MERQTIRVLLKEWNDNCEGWGYDEMFNWFLEKLALSRQQDLEEAVVKIKRFGIYNLHEGKRFVEISEEYLDTLTN